MKALLIALFFVLSLGVAGALSVSISSSDGANTYSESLTANLATSDYLNAQTSLFVSSGVTAVSGHVEGTGNISVTRSLTGHNSISSYASETDGSMNYDFSSFANGQAGSSLDNLTALNTSTTTFGFQDNYAHLKVATTGDLRAVAKESLTPDIFMVSIIPSCITHEFKVSSIMR